jgi:23S rRNA C2498 (ribose-2'-O)-methylase RlmM
MVCSMFSYVMRGGNRGGAVGCRVSRLRRSLAQALKSRHVPRLEFRRDAPSGEELAVDEALHRLQNEM